jgi:ABC-2 type transport system ATP-binding protein
MIEATGLTKRYGTTVAVDDLSFTVKTGRVTGFLGPNGAGKSTTMRMVLGLDRADAGTVHIDGKQMTDFAVPMKRVGALLDAGYLHPTRKASDHLWALAASNGLPKARVEQVLDLVGLSEVARKRVGGFSLGMRQRLGLASAMLGNPRTLLFDEPANGLDPEGIQWMRQFLKALAAEGRTVFVSSHLLSEMALIAEDLVVIGKGHLIYEGPLAGFVEGTSRAWVTIRSPELDRLATLLQEQGAQVGPGPDGRAASVTGVDAAAIGELAAAEQITLHELSPSSASLEEVFLEATANAQQYRGEPEVQP